MLMGESHKTVAEAFPAVAVTLIGADGAALIAALEDAVDSVDVPAALVAVALKV